MQKPQHVALLITLWVFFFPIADAEAQISVSITGSITGVSIFTGDGTFSGSSAYVQVWIDREGDGLAAPISGQIQIDDDILIREVPILNSTGLFGIVITNRIEPFSSGEYWIRAIASADGNSGISSANGKHGEDAARTVDDKGFGSAPDHAAIYGEGRITLDGKNPVGRIETVLNGTSLSFYVIDSDSPDKPGVLIVDSEFPLGAQ